ncbi:hypothetical protein AVEN_67713-1 [Araneus ventricosus]|uniref:Uncharacterized protein n=1 Tax=Araneus ventricosus TaxID=182803 RepID=A0A4Y2T2B3_ARAVE|nr:hypothetical protein AVEN_31236-1 [Araneus ventricosus]GBN94667.1 hypothetical protein AVEN_67713-1 [Araneus ventricosus]
MQKSDKKIEKKTENETKSERKAGLSCKALCQPPQKNSFTVQKIRREKATLYPFNLDGLWAAGRAALAGTEPTERETDAFFNLIFFFPHSTQRGNLIDRLWVLMPVCVASTETHLVD